MKQISKVPIVAPSFIASTFERDAGGAPDAVANGYAIVVASQPTATSGRFNTVKVESYLAPAAKAAAGGCYSVRGLVGVLAGKTYAPNAVVYLAGVQGKLDPAGAVGDGTGVQIYACAMLAQINNGAGSFGSEAQVYGLWVDNQFAGNPAGLSHLVNFTNNGGNLTNLIHAYGNNKITGQFMALETLGGVEVAATGVTTIAKALKVTIDGTQYYLPLCSGTT